MRFGEMYRARCGEGTEFLRFFWALFFSYRYLFIKSDVFRIVFSGFLGGFIVGYGWLDRCLLVIEFSFSFFIFFLVVGVGLEVLVFYLRGGFLVIVFIF